MNVDDIELSTHEYLEELVRLNALVKTNKKLAFLMGYMNEVGHNENQSAEPMDLVKQFVMDMNELSGLTVAKKD